MLCPHIVSSQCALKDGNNEQRLMAMVKPAYFTRGDVNIINQLLADDEDDPNGVYAFMYNAPPQTAPTAAGEGKVPKLALNEVCVVPKLALSEVCV